MRLLFVDLSATFWVNRQGMTVPPPEIIVVLHLLISCIDDVALLF